MNSYPPGAGGSVHLYQLIKKLTARDCQIYKYFTDPENPDVLYIRRRALLKFLTLPDIYYVRIDGRYFNEKFNWLKHFYLFNKPIIWEINSPLEEMLWRNILDIKTVSAQNSKRYKLARKTNGATAVSREMMVYAKNVLDIEKVKYVPNGSDPELFYRRKLMHPLFKGHEHKLKVIWSGSGEYIWQNIDLIEEIALALLKENYPIHFFIIGHNRRNNDLTNVTYIDSIPYLEIPELLGSADVGLCLYRMMSYEPYGFHLSPLKLYDYLASELVVIGSNLGQIKEVIRHGDNGYLVDDDVHLIIDLLKRIQESPVRSKEMGKEARKTVTEYYNWDRVADDTLELINDCMKNTTHPK